MACNYTAARHDVDRVHLGIPRNDHFSEVEVPGRPPWYAYPDQAPLRSHGVTDWRPYWHCFECGALAGQPCQSLRRLAAIPLRQPHPDRYKGDPDNDVWRTQVVLVEVTDTDAVVEVPARSTGNEVHLPLWDVPDWLAEADPGFRCHARVNLLVEDAAKLRFESWEQR